MKPIIVHCLIELQSYDYIIYLEDKYQAIQFF